jgi:hypothetical protein
MPSDMDKMHFNPQSGMFEQGPAPSKKLTEDKIKYIMIGTLEIIQFYRASRNMNLSINAAGGSIAVWPELTETVFAGLAIDYARYLVKIGKIFKENLIPAFLCELQVYELSSKTTISEDSKKNYLLHLLTQDNSSAELKFDMLFSILQNTIDKKAGM